MKDQVPCRRAFTLVELLVVVAIIAVMAAMLIPAVHRVKEQALSARCVSNLRAIGIALADYGKDNGMTIPMNTMQVLRRDSTPPYSDTDGVWWYQFLNGAENRFKIYLDDPTRNMLGIADHLKAAQVLKGKESAYRCPNMAQPWQFGTISYYGMHKSKAGQQHDPAGFVMPRGVPVHMTDGWEFRGIRLTAVRQPSNYGLVFDTSAYDDYRLTSGSTGWEAENIVSSGQPHQRSGIWLAHRGFANGLFADFHVESCNPQRLRTMSNGNRYVTGNRGVAAYKTYEGQEVKEDW